MPIIHACPQFLCNLIQAFLWLILRRPRVAHGGRARIDIGLFLWRTSGMSEILRIRSPVPIRDFHRDQAGQRLLLTRAIECWEFASDGHRWCGNGVLHYPRPGTQVGLHGLDIIIMSSAIRLVLMLEIARRRGTTLISLMKTGCSSQTLDAVPLTASLTTIPTIELISTISVI